MNGASDNVFTRWSRRKQAVRDSEMPATDQEEHAVDSVAAEADVKPIEQGKEVTEPDAAEPAEPLPRLEDLTAESDLSAFLREGVPKALKSAALRKIWSLDPAIRDYIGPSEYAWDFNQPGSMAGFGPLDAGKTAVEFLASMSSDENAGPAEAAAAPVDPGPPEAAPASPDAETEPDKPADMAPTDQSAEPSYKAANPQPSSSGDGVAGVEFEDVEKLAGPSGTAAPPRHGGAIPR